MNQSETHGRNRRSEKNVRVVPVYRTEPDIKKLGQALIAIARELAAQKAAEDAENIKTENGQEDDMP